MKRHFLPLAAILAASALGACGTIPFGGNATTFTTTGAGIGWNPATGVNAGYAQARLTTAPTVAKDSKGNIVPLTVAGPCGRTDMLDTYGILSGNASANATSTSTTGAPSLQASLAVNEGLMTGETARLAELAAVQSANPKIDALAAYSNCAQAQPAQASGAATTTPIP